MVRIDIDLVLCDALVLDRDGNTSFLEHPAQATEIYQRILADMNSRYAIGYYPSNKLRDGKRRSVTIQVRNHPEYRIEGRRSYLAPALE